MNTSQHNRLTGEQLGKIQNHLGFLIKDKSGHQGLNPEKFMKLTGLSGVNAAKTIDVSRQSIYKNFIPLKPSGRLTQRVYSLVTATDLAYELFNRSSEETTNWMMSPNSLLFGASPFEVCMRGDGAPLIEWLLNRSGKTPVLTA